MRAFALAFLAGGTLLAGCVARTQSSGDSEELAAALPAAAAPIASDPVEGPANAALADPPTPPSLTLETPALVSSKLSIVAADVGAGNCIAVQCPGSTDALLMDCGTVEGLYPAPKPAIIDPRAERAKQVMQPFLSGRNVRVVVTHPHADHLIFVPVVLENVAVKGVWLGGYANDYGDRQDLDAKYHFGAWLQARKDEHVLTFTNYPTGYHTAATAEPKLKCGNASVRILTVNNGGSPNSRSLVTLLSFGNFKAIFPGDAEGSTEAAVLQNFAAEVQDTSVLFAAHHGADTQQSNGTSWVSALRAQHVVYSSGTLYSHPNCESVDRYRGGDDLLTSKKHSFTCGKHGGGKRTNQSLIAEYITEEQGPVRISTDGSTVSITCDKGPC